MYLIPNIINNFIGKLRTTSGFDPSQLEAALAERNSLREAISKIASLRKQEMENQRIQKEEIQKFKLKAQKSDHLLEENKAANEKLKTVCRSALQL